MKCIHGISSLYHIWFLHLFISLSKQNQIRNYSNNLIKICNTEADKVTVNMIKNCYCENTNIVLSGDWRNNDVFTVNGAFGSLPPLYKVGVRQDRHFKRHKRLKNVFKLDERVVRKKKYPGNSFILMVSSTSTLTLTLRMLKESIMWNHEGFYLIVYKNDKDRCANAKSLLDLAWKFRLLYATVLCYDGKSTEKLFTFNPFMKFAPEFWRFVESHVERGSNWTLFEHELNSSSAISDPSFCKNLQFNKTRNLGGFVVRMGAFEHSRLLTLNKLKTGLERFSGVNGEMSRAIWSHLNASPRVSFYVRPGFLDETDSLGNVLQDLLSGRIELSMNSNLLRDFWRLQSYPHTTAGVCLVSRKQRTPASLRLLLRPGRSWPLLLAAGLGLLLVLTALAGRGSPSAGALQLTRLLASAPLHRLPSRPADHLLLALLALATTLLLGSRLRGELTALDAALEPESAIDSEAELTSSGLPAYGSLSFDASFREPRLRKRYHYGTYFECVERLLAGENIVCVQWCYLSTFYACEGGVFHTSRELREPRYMSFSTAEDWPLYARFNEMLRRLIEAGLITYYKNREADKYREDREDCVARDDRQRQVLQENVHFSLMLWSCGAVVAMVAFFVEVCLCVMKDLLISGWKGIRRALLF